MNVQFLTKIEISIENALAFETIRIASDMRYLILLSEMEITWLTDCSATRTVVRQRSLLIYE